jgi:hypothetical protein
MLRRFIDIVVMVAILIVVGLAIANREKFTSLSKATTTPAATQKSETPDGEQPVTDVQQSDNEDIATKEQAQISE